MLFVRMYHNFLVQKTIYALFKKKKNYAWFNTTAII